MQQLRGQKSLILLFFIVQPYLAIGIRERYSVFEEAERWGYPTLKSFDCIIKAGGYSASVKRISCAL